MNFRFSILSCLLACVLVAPVAAEQPALETDDEKMLYTLGNVLSRRLAEYRLTPEEAAIVGRGLSDGLTGRGPVVDVEAYAPRMETYFGERVRRVAAAERLAGDGYREQIAKEKGAITTGTGLIYREGSPGTGARPAADDTVRLRLTGTLRGGKVFVENDGGSIALADALPCLREGILRMREGGTATLVCPPEIAFGNRGAPPHVLPGATIVYDVELLGVDKADP